LSCSIYLLDIFVCIHILPMIKFPDKTSLLFLSLISVGVIIIIGLLIRYPAVDEQVRLALEVYQSRWLTGFLVAISNSVYLLTLPLLVMLFLLRISISKIVWSIASVGFSQLVIEVLKDIIKRPRPVVLDIVYQSHYTGYSFPSGHAAMATILCGLMLYLVNERLTFVQRRALLSTMVLYCLLVGWSRIYVGAHYPSDVLGGYLLGGILVRLLPFAIKVDKK
jgi:undecaprenyl-diphosphatase